MAFFENPWPGWKPLTTPMASEGDLSMIYPPQIYLWTAAVNPPRISEFYFCTRDDPSITSRVLWLPLFESVSCFCFPGSTRRGICLPWPLGSRPCLCSLPRLSTSRTARPRLAPPQRHKQQPQGPRQRLLRRQSSRRLQNQVRMPESAARCYCWLVMFWERKL